MFTLKYIFLHTHLSIPFLPCAGNKVLKMRNFCNGRTDIQTHKGKTVYPLFLRRVGIIKKPAIIKKSTSPFYSPVALVKKGNSEYRFCIDFTKPMSFTIITFQRKQQKNNIYLCLLTQKRQI